VAASAPAAAAAAVALPPHAPTGSTATCQAPAACTEPTVTPAAAAAAAAAASASAAAEPAAPKARHEDGTAAAGDPCKLTLQRPEDAEQGSALRGDRPVRARRHLCALLPGRALLRPAKRI
jgi:hypothetical protein